MRIPSFRAAARAAARRKTRRWPEGLPLALLLLTASPATGHQGDPNVVTRVDAVTPALPGVRVEVRTGVADQLHVVNDTDRPVEVLDAAGRPFLRIGPDVVEADFASVAFLTSASPDATAPAPSGTRAEWRPVMRGNAWGWFDHRLHPEPYAASAARVVTRLADWRLPIRHGGRVHTVTGHVEYRPRLGALRTRVVRAPPEVSVDALDGRVPGLFLTWRGRGTLTIRDARGEVFARVSPEGTSVLLTSPVWIEDQRLRGQVGFSPYDARAGFHAVGREPTLTWLDRRLAYEPVVPPEDVVRARRVAPLVEWRIDVDVAGVPDFVAGVTEWVPNDPVTPGGRNRALAAAAAAVAGALAIAYAVRRRARER